MPTARPLSYIYGSQAAPHQKFVPLEHAQREIAHWRAVAAYLADCHAATAAYDGKLAGTSKIRRQRLGAICSEAAKLLDGDESRFNVSRALEQEEITRIVERCRRAAEEGEAAGVSPPSSPRP